MLSHASAHQRPALGPTNRSGEFDLAGKHFCSPGPARSLFFKSQLRLPQDPRRARGCLRRELRYALFAQARENPFRRPPVARTFAFRRSLSAEARGKCSLGSCPWPLAGAMRSPPALFFSLPKSPVL